MVRIRQQGGAGLSVKKKLWVALVSPTTEGPTEGAPGALGCGARSLVACPNQSQKVPDVSIFGRCRHTMHRPKGVVASPLHTHPSLFAPTAPLPFPLGGFPAWKRPTFVGSCLRQRVGKGVKWEPGKGMVGVEGGSVVD